MFCSKLMCLSAFPMLEVSSLLSIFRILLAEIIFNQYLGKLLKIKSSSLLLRRQQAGGGVWGYGL